MNQLPYLLPWVRVLLLIRSITSTTWGLPERAVTAPRTIKEPVEERPGDAHVDVVTASSQGVQPLFGFIS